MGKYTFKPYSDSFPLLFSKEKERIAPHLPSSASIEHVGSTSVPGLGGKGIIDIAIAVDKDMMEEAKNRLQELEYEFRPSFSTPDRFYFIIYLPDPEEGSRRYHVHLTYPESKEWRELTGFRDFLLSNPDALQEYAELKKKAAVEASQDGEKYRKAKEPMFQKFNAFQSTGYGKEGKEMNKKERPKISVYIALSIDGYIARKDDSLDWLDRVGGFDEDYGFQNLLASIDALIIGRKTYAIASTVPDPYPGKRVVVLSNSLDSVKAGMELYKGDLVELAEKLHREGIKHVWVDGGSTISQFLSLQLVDEMTLSVIPIVLGEGIPLFHAMGKEIPCRLLSSQSYRSGLVQQHYEIIKQFAESQDNIHFKLVNYGSEDYKKGVALREEILRKPLGLFFTKEELEQEKEHVHIAGFLGQEMCATAVLVPDGEEIKMDRVALKVQFQGKGIGSALMRFCEEYAKKHGFKSIYCHARGTAVHFYLKNLYELEGEPFDEDGIPHRKMRKLI